ncbi:MAG: hypothetical protein GY821_16200 [Gammaproteobacteria bacterium]|nr:hypothetical protein [Gammaproteobacteria bacterium]
MILDKCGSESSVAKPIFNNLLHLEKSGLNKSDDKRVRKVAVKSIVGDLKNTAVSNEEKLARLNLLSARVDEEESEAVLVKILEALNHLRAGNEDLQDNLRNKAIEIAVKIMKKGKKLYWWYNDTKIIEVLENIEPTIFAQDGSADQFRADVEACRKNSSSRGDDFAIGEDSLLQFAYNVLVPQDADINGSGIGENITRYADITFALQQESSNKSKILGGSVNIVPNVSDRDKNVNQKPSNFSLEGRSFVASVGAQSSGTIIENDQLIKNERSQNVVANDTIN